MRRSLSPVSALAAWFFHYQPGDMGQMINFMKNITIAGGFLVLAGAGPGAFALDNLRRQRGNVNPRRFRPN